MQEMDPEEIVETIESVNAALEGRAPVEPPSMLLIDDWRPVEESEEATFYEVHHLAWPGGERDLVQEFVYRVDAAGQVVPGKWTEEERAALQALVDYRGPEARKPGRGNSLEEISSDSPEARLSHALALAMLPPEGRQAYNRALEEERQAETIRALVSAAYEPVCFYPGFTVRAMEVLEDGTGLVEVIEEGPNWTTRYTLYVLALTPEIEIIQAYTPYGEHCINHHFHTGPIYEPDESGRFYTDFRAVLARIWRDCPNWLGE